MPDLVIGGRKRADAAGWVGRGLIGDGNGADLLVAIVPDIGLGIGGVDQSASACGGVKCEALG